MAMDNAERQRIFRQKIKQSGGKRIVTTINQEQIEAINDLLDLDLQDLRKSKYKFYITECLNRAVAAKQNIDRLKAADVSAETIQAYIEAERLNLREPLPMEEHIQLFEEINDLKKKAA